jgi:hypothetical protein
LGEEIHPPLTEIVHGGTVDGLRVVSENGGAKVCHGSGGIVPLRAE